MPRMIPERVDADAPDSERYVFSRLAAGLPEGWTVLHGRRLVVPGGGRDGARAAGSAEGEADFVVLDPGRGYLVLEAKGGGVGRDEGGWYSIDRSRRRNRIKSPGEQASRAARLLDAYLTGRPWFRSHRVRPRFGWGVVLPDVDVAGDIGADLPRGAVIDRLDLGDPHAALERVFRAQLGAGQPLPEAAERALVEALAPCFQLAVPLASQIVSEQAELVRLTEEQVAILDHLEAWPRAVIEGHAGTGKTLIAVEKARRLAADGQRVLLLCFNRPLADFLKSVAQGFAVNSFHGLCHDLCERAEVAFRVPRGPREAKRFWEDEAPELLERALTALPDERFDALVVDEGQDFREHWWIVLEDCLREPGAGTLYVFFDPNQDLYGGGPPKALGILPAKLRWNCRNTGSIAEYAADLIGGGAEVRPGTPAGVPVEEFSCDGQAAVADCVRRLLHRFVAEGRVATERVVVLSTHNPDRSSLKRARRLGRFELVALDAEPGPDRIRFASLQRFKGLEADVVILIDVEPGGPTSSPRHLYVGASRARHVLAVVRVNDQTAGPGPNK